MSPEWKRYFKINLLIKIIIDDALVLPEEEESEEGFAENDHLILLRWEVVLNHICFGNQN